MSRCLQIPLFKSRRKICGRRLARSVNYDENSLSSRAAIYQCCAPLGSNAFLSKHRATVFAAVAPGQVIRVLNDSLVNFGWSGFLLSAAVLPRLFHAVAC